jgi:hypothetical protein
MGPLRGGNLNLTAFVRSRGASIRAKAANNCSRIKSRRGDRGSFFSKRGKCGFEFTS